MTESPVRLMIVDDHTLFREGLQAIFLAVADIEIVGEAATGKEAVSKAQELKPDIILMDIQMGDMNGIEATKHILEILPETKIIMLTMLEDSESLFAAMVAGARSYVLKGADKAEVLKTIRLVTGGEILFGAAIADRVTNYFRNLDIRPAAQAALNPQFAELTERELEILDHIARGMNNHEIAKWLQVTVKTVSNHISNIFNKLHVADRAQAYRQSAGSEVGER